MSCYHPVTGWRGKNGKLTLSNPEGKYLQELTVPCGGCIGCKIDKARDWSIRCYHEAQIQNEDGKPSSFITLTYDDEHLPGNGSLDHRHFQEFMKNLRWHVPEKLRYYMCGEYGDTNGRPHYHAILFGWDFFDDRYFWRERNGTRYYRSPLLEKCWRFGFSDLSDFTHGAAAYVARYVSKKINGPDAAKHYVNEHGESIAPEYNRMSLKPGLGEKWFLKYKTDIFPKDHVIVNGKEYPVPRYYTQLQERFCPTMVDLLKKKRKREAKEREEDNTFDRRLVKESCAKGKLKKRNLNNEI